MENIVISIPTKVQKELLQKLPEILYAQAENLLLSRIALILENPYKKEMYWTFSECIRGMGDACRFFKTPVTGGNVSFYNETVKSAVYPTPTIGMIGLLEDMNLATTQYFKAIGDVIVLLGKSCNIIGGSE